MPSYIRGNSTNLNSLDHELIVKYLLGSELDPQDLRHVEDLYFSNQSVMEQIELVEDELIERYLRGELRPDKKRRFERHFLASRRNQERLVFFQHLSRLTSRRQSTNLAGVRRLVKERAMALLAACLVLLISSVWLTIQHQQLLSELGRLESSSSIQIQRQAEATRKLADQLRNEQDLRRRLEENRAATFSDHGRGNASAVAVLSFSLMPSTTDRQTRGQGNPESGRHAIPRSVNVLQLDLILSGGANAKSYMISIETPDGTVVWSGGPIIPISVGQLVRVRVSIPAMVIGDDDYVVNLQSIGTNHQLETGETYLFRTLVTH